MAGPDSGILSDKLKYQSVIGCQRRGLLSCPPFLATGAPSAPGWASQPPNCTPSQENPTEPQQPGREMSFSEKLQIMSTLKQELSAHLVGAHCCSEFNENIWCCSSLTSNAVPTQIGVTVFLIYGLCTQDLTRLQAKQICG